MEHLLDVGASFRPGRKPRVWRRPCCRPYPPRYRAAFAFSNLSMPFLH